MFPAILHRTGLFYKEDGADSEGGSAKAAQSEEKISPAACARRGITKAAGCRATAGVRGRNAWRLMRGGGEKRSHEPPPPCKAAEAVFSKTCDEILTVSMTHYKRINLHLFPCCTAALRRERGGAGEDKPSHKGPLRPGGGSRKLINFVIKF